MWGYSVSRLLPVVSSPVAVDPDTSPLPSRANDLGASRTPPPGVVLLELWPQSALVHCYTHTRTQCAPHENGTRITHTLFITLARRAPLALPPHLIRGTMMWKTRRRLPFQEAVRLSQLEAERHSSCGGAIGRKSFASFTSFTSFTQKRAIRITLFFLRTQRAPISLSRAQVCDASQSLRLPSSSRENTLRLCMPLSSYTIHYPL